MRRVVSLIYFWTSISIWMPNSWSRKTFWRWLTSELKLCFTPENYWYTFTSWCVHTRCESSNDARVPLDFLSRIWVINWRLAFLHTLRWICRLRPPGPFQEERKWWESRTHRPSLWFSSRKIHRPCLQSQVFSFPLRSLCPNCGWWRLRSQSKIVNGVHKIVKMISSFMLQIAF